MHAFLLVGNSLEGIDKSIVNLSQKLSAKIIEFPLLKISDTRDLNDLLRLSFNEPTLIVCKNIHAATEEALNAFLKNLEEPQENIYFALTSPNERKVLPTITSRCQIIKVYSSELIVHSKDAENFLKVKTGEKLKLIDKIKDRAEAIKFVEGLIFYTHKEKDFRFSEILINTLKKLNSNGNTLLQLTDLVVKMNLANE